MKKSNGDTKIGVVVIPSTITKMALNIVATVAHVAITKEMANMIAFAPKITPNIAEKIVRNAVGKQTAPLCLPA